MCLTFGSPSDPVDGKASFGFCALLAGTADSGKAELDLGSTACLAQSVERKALNLVVVGSSPTVGVLLTVGVSGALPCSLLEIVCSDHDQLVEKRFGRA